MNVCTLACYTNQVFYVRHDSALTPISVGFVFTKLLIIGVTVVMVMLVMLVIFALLTRKRKQFCDS